MDQLFEELQQPIYRFLLRLCGNEDLASDLTQETLARGWQKRRQLQSEQAAKTWFFRIALNIWKDHTRRAGDLTEFSEQTVPESRELGPMETAIARELGLEVWQAIAELPARQQQIMHLRIIEQWEISDIADLLQIDRHLVRSNLAAGRSKLRQRFSDRCLTPSPGKSIHDE